MERNGCWISVISHARSRNVARMTSIIGGATWYVGYEERETYSAAGAASVVQSGPLCISRNQSLQDAFARGLVCVQVSDDLIRLHRVSVSSGKGKRIPVSFDECIDEMVDASDGIAMLAGVASTDSLIYSVDSPPLSFSTFILGDLFACRPCDLRFDERLTLKEDYDWTMQHITRYGNVCRLNRILAGFAHRTNKGGVCTHRSLGTENENIDMLIAKWGGAIVRNPKKPGEVLLRL